MTAVELLRGIKDGALLQRDKDGLCRCVFTAQADGVLKTTLGTLQDNGNGRYVLTGIPAGGPYELEIYDNLDRKKLTVWVGDLWILAGQSNMEGSGCVTEEVEAEAKNAIDRIRCYYLDARWDKAVPVTHEPWLSPDECIGGRWRKERLESAWKTDRPDRFCDKPVKLRAVGPGYYFAKKMYEITNVPQGVIPCALGGSSLAEWGKGYNNGNGLYSVMIRRFKEAGSFVRGVFWDQGEAETHSGDNFTANMIKFINDVRCDTANAKMPFVQVQIARCAVYNWFCDNPENGISWSGIKEEQRTLDKKIPFLKTVSAIDADFDDLIHYSAKFQKKMGIRAANAMAYLVGEGGSDVPVPYRITYRKNDEYSPSCYIYDIEYKNVKTLTSLGVPSGFCVLPKACDTKKVFSPFTGVQKIKLCGNTVSLYTEIKEEPEEALICYGFGHMAYCNITTDTGYSIPAMGPVAVKEVQNAATE